VITKCAACEAGRCYLCQIIGCRCGCKPLEPAAGSGLSRVWRDDADRLKAAVALALEDPAFCRLIWARLLVGSRPAGE
jgi:hypothetical protein